MRITSAQVDLSSTHVKTERSSKRESLRSWVGDRRPDFEALERNGEGRRGLVGRDDGDAADDGPENRRALIARRVAGLARQLGAESAALGRPQEQAQPSSKSGDADDEDEALKADPKSLAIKLIVEAMTGRKIKVVSLEKIRDAQAESGVVTTEGQPPAQERAGWGLEYELHESHHEVEQTSFAARGVVKTADGKDIAFSYELDMAREYHAETHVSVRAGDALLKDPLVINFGGTAAQLTEQRYAFDLDADGARDQVAWVQPGSGFLALDKNGNGTIDDGSELFGAMTGDGFAELAAYDDDKNGWIDEADAVYGRLQVWSRSGDESQLASLKDRNVGAISVERVSTPFELKDDANQLQGAVRATGIYVKEDGSGVGSVQQVDLAV